MMNGRPLTQISSDFRDVEPITPNHFLLGRPSPSIPPGIFLDKSVTISSSWKQAQQISDQFWNPFSKRIHAYSPQAWQMVHSNPKFAAWRLGLGTRRFYTTWVMADGKS